MDVFREGEGKEKKWKEEKRDVCVTAERSGVNFCCVSLLVCKHVQSPSELLSAEQGQEGSGRRNTTYGGLMRFYLEGFSKKG